VAYFGWFVISAVLASAVLGAIAACFDDEKGLGKEFLEGIYAIGTIFLPVAGIMASVPFLSALIQTVFGPIFAFIGADPAMAATTFIAVDMGGYQLARELKTTNEHWITAMTTGYMAGSTIVFSIPVGLALLQKRDHKYMALGAMAGLLSIPIGVLVANLILWVSNPEIRDFIGIKGVPNYSLHMSLSQILLDIVPLAIIMSALALGLRIAPDLMIRSFMLFGRVMGILIKLVLVACIVEYFTAATFDVGLFTKLFGSWKFEPVIADADQVKEVVKKTGAVADEQIYRAIEVAGYIGLMLAGAFPMVYLIRKYFSRPVEFLGRKVGLDAVGAAGMLAAVANILAMFRLVKDMRARDKVLTIAFAVCAAFLFGDHLAFTTNFQPTLLVPVLVGKLTGGVFGFLIATALCVPKALQLEKQDMLDDAKALLQHVPALRDKAVTIQQLGGGLTNRIYKIDAGDEAYVLRIAGANTELLGIDRDREEACMQVASAVHVGPEVVAYLPEHDALVTRFLPGKLLCDEDVQRPDVLPRIAETLRRCHEAPIPEHLGAFSVFDTVRNYVTLATERHVPLPSTLRDALGCLERIEKEVATDDPPCLTHNDLLAGNFIGDGTTMRLIDWEYGGKGDRFFDLGNLAVNLQLSESQEKVVLQGYFGEVLPEHLRRLRLMRLASDLREATWAYLQSAISKLAPAEPYPTYGKRHLDRFLAGASAMGIDARN
jgi:ethanolamine transporter